VELQLYTLLISVLDKGVSTDSCPSRFIFWGERQDSILMGWETAWAPEPAWKRCWREKLFHLLEIKSWSSKS